MHDLRGRVLLERFLDAGRAPLRLVDAVREDADLRDAELLGTSERFPRRLIAERRIRFVRLSENGKRGHVRIPESALREFIAAGVVEPLTATGVAVALVSPRSSV
jgi:excisionase family DNA binding protein